MPVSVPHVPLPYAIVTGELNDESNEDRPNQVKDEERVMSCLQCRCGGRRPWCVGGGRAMAKTSKKFVGNNNRLCGSSGMSACWFLQIEVSWSCFDYRAMLCGTINVLTISKFYLGSKTVRSDSRKKRRICVLALKQSANFMTLTSFVFFETRKIVFPTDER